jgi:hypothetical protein
VAPLSEIDARILMSDLLVWPTREVKPEWWQFFERRDRYELAEFIEDSETIGGLELEGEVDQVARSTIWRYRFDPDQDCKVRIGDALVDPLTGRPGRPVNAGRVMGFDPIAGTIDLQRGNGSAEPHPVVVMPASPIGRGSHIEALRDVADALLRFDIDGPGPFRAARRLVLRQPPVLTSTPARGEPLRDEGESTLDAANRLVDGLDKSVLPIQGPPGSGKTFTAAHVIVEQIAKGRKVGVTGPSHSAIMKLLEKVVDVLIESGATATIVKKVGQHHDPATELPGIAYVSDQLSAYVASADIVAGTSWAFTRPDMREAVDLLLVDEAGQLSLADVVAISTSARNVVLVGDPMQLSQPAKGSHPGMAALSALEHLCAGSATVPADAGLLLDVSWRMNPSICSFISEQIYDGRLRSRPECAKNVVTEGPVVGGHGLRWLPVDHSDNRTSSIEEADAVATVCTTLLGRPWTNSSGATNPIGTDDILVVTPYNAQANLIRQRLRNSIKVGTVDMFQGREAAVVIVSMAASTLEDIPRGIDFLLSKNRLNVAISRAKAMCVLIGSPELLTARCSTLSQIRLVNTLCRYAEVADHVDLESELA